MDGCKLGAKGPNGDQVLDTAAGHKAGCQGSAARNGDKQQQQQRTCLTPAGN